MIICLMITPSCVLWQLRHLESVLKKRESEVVSLEEDKIRLKKVSVEFVLFI